MLSFKRVKSLTFLKYLNCFHLKNIFILNIIFLFSTIFSLKNKMSNKYLHLEHLSQYSSFNTQIVIKIII